MAFKKLFGRKAAKPLSSMPSSNIDNVMNSCFDCNICLDFVRDPVVTFCGHLYCWACIYKWFTVQSTSLASDEHPQCPVCKAEISETTVVPLYGRGQTPSYAAHNQSTKPPSIPPRPPAYGTMSSACQPSQQLPSQNPYQDGDRQYHPPYQDRVQVASSLLNQDGSPSVNVVHPVLEMAVGMIHARLLGNSSRNIYSFQNSYRQAMNPRLSRQEMQAYKLLNRISVFFFCCTLLCLALF